MPGIGIKELRIKKGNLVAFGIVRDQNSFTGHFAGQLRKSQEPRLASDSAAKRIWRDLIYSHKVHPSWQEFSTFLSDMGQPPSTTISIGKLKAEGSYGPGNCFWVVPKYRESSAEIMYTFKAYNRSLDHMEICDNQTEFAKKWNLEARCISKCLAGKQTHHKGWVFSKISDSATIHSTHGRSTLKL